MLDLNTLLYNFCTFNNPHFDFIKDNEIGCWEFMKQKPQLCNSQQLLFYFVIVYIVFIDNDKRWTMEITDDIFQSFYLEEKVIDSDVVWKRFGESYITEHLEIMNETITDYEVTLIGKVDDNNYFAFIIVYRYRKSKELVKYDKTIHSPNYIDSCSKQQLMKPHKHKFKKGCKKDLEAKIISNSEIDRNDVNKAFYQFLEECNIRLEGTYIPIIIPPVGTGQTKIFQYSDSIFNHIKGGGKK